MPAVSDKVSEIYRRMNLLRVRLYYVIGSTSDLLSTKSASSATALKPFYGRARKFLSCWFLCLPVQTINGLHEPSSTCTRSRFRSRQMFRNLSSLLQEIRLTTTIRESEVLIRTPNFLVLINRECDDSAGYEILTQFWLNPKTALSFFVKYIGIREKMRDPYIKLILLYILFLFCLIKNTNCTIGVWV